MIETFKFKSQVSSDREEAILGTLPAGKILKSEPVFEDGEAYWLIVVDTGPQPYTPQEHYVKA
jgi:hypothetical protein